jgi:hypothetical protein
MASTSWVYLGFPEEAQPLFGGFGMMQNSLRIKFKFNIATRATSGQQESLNK